MHSEHHIMQCFEVAMGYRKVIHQTPFVGATCVYIPRRVDNVFARGGSMGNRTREV